MLMLMLIVIGIVIVTGDDARDILGDTRRQGDSR